MDDDDNDDDDAEKQKKMKMSLRHLCLLQNETARQQKKNYVQIEEKKNENRRNTSCRSSRIAVSS